MGPDDLRQIEESPLEVETPTRDERMEEAKAARAEHDFRDEVAARTKAGAKSCAAKVRAIIRSH